VDVLRQETSAHYGAHARETPSALRVPPAAEVMNGARADLVAVNAFDGNDRTRSSHGWSLAGPDAVQVAADIYAAWKTVSECQASSSGSGAASAIFGRRSCWPASA
jgi:hypothetical protein